VTHGTASTQVFGTLLYLLTTVLNSHPSHLGCTVLIYLLPDSHWMMFQNIMYLQMMFGRSLDVDTFCASIQVLPEH
jgi:hypothetical protein